MSHSQFHCIKSFILRHAWLNLWDKHMTTGRINQVTILTSYHNSSQLSFALGLASQSNWCCNNSQYSQNIIMSQCVVQVSLCGCIHTQQCWFRTRLASQFFSHEKSPHIGFSLLRFTSSPQLVQSQLLPFSLQHSKDECFVEWYRCVRQADSVGFIKQSQIFYNCVCPMSPHNALFMVINAHRESIQTLLVFWATQIGFNTARRLRFRSIHQESLT